MPFTLTREDAESIFLPRETGNTAPLFARCTPSTTVHIGASEEHGKGLGGLYTFEEFKTVFAAGLFAVFDVPNAHRELVATELVGNKWIEEQVMTVKTRKGEDYQNKLDAVITLGCFFNVDAY